jgi:hypothetical protein
MRPSPRYLGKLRLFLVHSPFLPPLPYPPFLFLSSQSHFVSRLNSSFSLVYLFVSPLSLFLSTHRLHSTTGRTPSSCLPPVPEERRNGHAPVPASFLKLHHLQSRPTSVVAVTTSGASIRQLPTLPHLETPQSPIGTELVMSSVCSKQ